jgi:hypothetical protein
MRDLSAAWIVLVPGLVLGLVQAPPRGLVSPCPGCGYPPEPRDDGNHLGWTQIFDGTTLKGWDGNPEVWHVEDGAITAESTTERRVGTTFLIWRGAEPSDFELKLEIKAAPDIHSGVFYRGKVGPAPPRPAAAARNPPPAGRRLQLPPPAVPADPRWNVLGYGLDFDYGLDNDGNVQDTTRSETQIGWRGHVVRMEPGMRPRVVGAIGDRDMLRATVRQGEWNQLHIIARGGMLSHFVNGQLMAVVIDDDPVARRTAGVIALQIEQFGTGTVAFRNIWLKQ